MKLVLVWTLTALASHTNQLISERYNNPANSDNLHLSFSLRRETQNETRTSKRTSSISKKIRNENLRYIIDFNMGNPPQHIEAELDLRYRGSYIVTVERPDIYATIRPMSSGAIDGILYPTKSETFTRLSPFIATHSSFYDTAPLAYSEDDTYIGVSVFEKFRFMMVHHTSERAMIGIGPQDASEYISEEYQKEESTNILTQMKQKGWIAKASFSLWIGSEGSDASGVISFSSVDLRYVRTGIYIFPLLRIKTRRGYYVKIDSVNLIDADGNVIAIAKLSMPAKLDFSMAFSRLPLEVIKQLYNSYDESPNFKVTCETEIARGSIGMAFSGVHFAIPFKYILPECQRGKKVSDLPFYPGNRAIIGANILSALYLVFDLDTYEVGIALARTDIGVETAPKSIRIITERMPGTSAPSYSLREYRNYFSIVGGDSFTYNEKAKKWQKQ